MKKKIKTRKKERKRESKKERKKEGKKGRNSSAIGMDGAMATMCHSDFKCSIGKGSVETMFHNFLET